MIASLILGVAAMTMQPQGVESLGWMTGQWRTRERPMPRSGPHWAEEIWSGADNYLMVGARRAQRGFGFHAFSYMRIEQDDRGVTLHLSSGEGADSRYRMTRSGDREAVFDNVAGGARITYRRAGDTLTSIHSRIDGSQASSWTYIRVPAGPGDAP